MAQHWGTPPPPQGPPPQGPQGHHHHGHQPQGWHGHQQPAGQQHHYGATAPPSRYDTRFWLGLVCTVIGCLIGLALLVKVFVVDIPPSQRDLVHGALGKATIFAYLPVALYLFIPYFVDRYDPEPAWALAGVFLWGALFATGVSAVLNTEGGILVGDLLGDAELGNLYSLAVSAPVFEELTKGMAILGMVLFLRREFDGVVDGIIYGAFVALGFAATENIIYYGKAVLMDTVKNTGGEGLTTVFVLRGVLTPWLHPLFTAMTGWGFGAAREATEGWKKVAYPLLGYCVAVGLHAWWNGMPAITQMKAGATAGGVAVILNLVVGILMALSFFVLLCVLVYRKGKVMKKYLKHELLVGTINQEEYDLITSYGGRLKARLSWRGKPGSEFVAAGARLALSMYHTDRAMRGSKKTLSADFIVPLRQELIRLRQEMMARVPR